MKPLYFLFFFLLIACGHTTLSVNSPAFNENEMIPAKYTCMGENINPEISSSGIPVGAKSLALIMDDPDAPSGDFVHWVMWNIPTDGKIAENSAPGIQGVNDAGENKYKGPVRRVERIIIISGFMRSMLNLICQHRRTRKDCLVQWTAISLDQGS